MDRGFDDHPTSLAPVPAYPRRAVEQYLADARQAWEQLQVSLREAEARGERASGAIESASESHRLLGAMMVDAQQDLAARIAHAESAAERLLADAGGEAERILASARAQVAVILGFPAPAPASESEPSASPSGAAPVETEPGPAEHDDQDYEPPRGPSPEWSRPAAWSAEADAAFFGGDEPLGAVVSNGTEVMADLWTARRPASIALDSLRWRPRWRRAHEPDWPFNAAHDDDSYFSRLRDDLRADGASAWLEPA